MNYSFKFPFKVSLFNRPILGALDFSDLSLL